MLRQKNEVLYSSVIIYVKSFFHLQKSRETNVRGIL